MLRRLVRRFSGDWTGSEGHQHRESTTSTFCSSEKLVTELSLDFDLEDDDTDDDETDRRITEAGETNGFEPHAIAFADAQRSGRRWVWIPDAEAVWKVALVTAESADGSSYTVVAADGRGEIEVPAAKCADYDPSHSLDLADASRMNQMHEGPLLDLLNRRFQANTIYTNVADVLVSINPYKDIPGLYDIPLPVTSLSTMPSSPLVRNASPGGRVAERTAALMRGFEEDSGKGTPRRPSSRVRGKGSREERDAEEEMERERETKARLVALKDMLGKPHVYGVADRAFKYMAETRGREVDGRIRKNNQSILITGESGSGKTEASKYIMRFLITASRALAGAGGVAISPGGVASTPIREAAASAGAAKNMENVLLKSTTVLEAFGNAKTVRNDNSSRFGKYIKLMYDEDLRLVGAKTEHFLLEKSRLVHLDNGERSYHILYQVAKALPKKAKGELGLELVGAENFRLLNQGNCLDASDDVNDHEEFKIVDKALTSLRFSSGEKKDVWRLLAAILHSGQVRFENVPGTDHSRMAKRGAGEQEGALSQLSQDELASLWGLDKAVFETALVQRTVKAGGASASIKLNAAQAKDNMLALLKHMYRQLFAWINWKINGVFDVVGGVQVGGGNGVGRTFIGILDIFGFEIMATNSFEQLCINYANEVLQQQFNHHIFVLEQEEYGAEGLDVESIPFRDNQDIIDLIAMRPAGLMPILEDQALTGRQAASMKSSFTDKNLLDLFHQEHHRKAPHPCYRKPRFDGTEFIVLHYAGDVTYCVSGFLEKNNDTLHEDLRELLLSSRVPFLQQLVLSEGSGTFGQGAPKSRNGPFFSPSKIGRTHPLLGRRNSNSKNDAFSVEGDRQLKRAASTKIAAKMTVSNAFRRQLDDLVTQLKDTEPHYIKCIKPNASKEPGGWSNALVIEQLRYSGVLEVVRIRREAFPMRVTYKQFYRLFGKIVSYTDAKLLPTEDITTTQARMASLAICEKVFGKDGAETSFQMGKTKLFLRNDGLKRMKGSLRQHFSDLATRIQSFWRGAAARMRLATQQDAAIKIQRIARGRITKQRYEKTRSAITTAQSVVRMWIARLKYKKCAASAVSIQALWRGWRQRSWKTRNTNATRLQAVARGFIARQRKKKAEAAVRLQVYVAPIVRGFLVRRRCKRRKKSIVALQAAFRGVVARKMLAVEAEKRAVAEAAKKEMAATRLVAVWRGKLQRLRIYEMGVNAAKIQSLVRGRAARKACKERMAKVVKAQGAARMILAKRSFKRTRVSALRVQRAIRAFLRNRHLRNRSIRLFEAARWGEASSVAGYLNEWPELLFVRDCYDAARTEAGLPSYSTLLHAACEGGSTDVVALLEPFLADVMTVNRWGDTSVHAAAALCHYSTLKLLGRRANIDTAAALRSAADGHPVPEPESLPIDMSKDAFSSTAGMIRGMRLSDAAFTYSRYASRRQKELNNDSGGVDVSALVVAMEGGSLTPVEGVLKKKRETGRWQKRWCSIRQFSPLPGDEGERGPALLYYRTRSEKKPSKVIMLQHCMLKRSGHVNHGFELHSPVLTSSNNKEGRLLFQAGDEEDLQRWIVPLRVLVKFYDFQNDKRALPMEFLDIGKRHRLVRVQNRRGQTPLHFAIAYKGSESSVSGGNEVMAAIQRVATWLIENGADPNAYDDEGETPMHYAAALAQAAIVRELEKRGGDCHLSRRVDRKTAAELLLPTPDMKLGLRPYGFAPKRTVLSSADVTDTPLLNPPSKLVGFTYVSIFLEELSLPSSLKVARPTLTMSVFSPKGIPVETGQDVTSPVLALTNYFWWAQTWHMRTPLETLGPGSMVIFELRDLQAGEKNNVLCWGALPLDHDLLDTKPERMSTFLPPTDPAKLSKTRRSSGCLGLATGGSKRDSDAPPAADASLSGDVILTRASR